MVNTITCSITNMVYYGQECRQVDNCHVVSEYALIHPYLMRCCFALVAQCLLASFTEVHWLIRLKTSY